MSLCKRMAASAALYGGTALWTMTGLAVAGPAYMWLRLARGMPKHEAVRMLIWLYGRVWVALAGLLMPVSSHRGRISDSCVLVANHASFFDVYFMGAQPQWNVCMALKGWPFRIPCYVWFMRAAGYLNLEELSLEQTLLAARKELARGAALLFFPEGTRSRNGRLGRFRTGAFLAALQCRAPVVPLCLFGTHGLLPRGAWLISPGPVVVRALDAVHAEGLWQRPDGHLLLAKQVRGMISDALDGMEQGAIPPQNPKEEKA